MRPQTRRAAAAIMSGTETGGEEVPLAFTPTTILPPAPHEAFTRAKAPDVPSRAFFTLVRWRCTVVGGLGFTAHSFQFVSAGWGWGDWRRPVTHH